MFEHEIDAPEAGKTTRRTFLISAAGALGALYFWSRGERNTVRAMTTDTANKEITIAQFNDSGKPEGKIKVHKLVKTDAEWHKQLSEQAYYVTRKAGTERAFTGQYWDNHEKGLYRCICCGTALFTSDTKFESGTGWPSFWAPIAKENVQEHEDRSLGGILRIEVLCHRCDAHLGHVFDDGPRPTGLRYCMNSVSLRFVKSS